MRTSEVARAAACLNMRPNSRTVSTQFDRSTPSRSKIGARSSARQNCSLIKQVDPRHPSFRGSRTPTHSRLARSAQCIPDTHHFVMAPASTHSQLARSMQDHGLWSFRKRRTRVPDARQTVSVRHPRKRRPSRLSRFARGGRLGVAGAASVERRAHTQEGGQATTRQASLAAPGRARSGPFASSLQALQESDPSAASAIRRCAHGVHQPTPGYVPQ